MAVQLQLLTFVTDAGVPVTGLTGANIPEIEIWNAGTGAVVQASTDGTEVAGGWYRFSFTPTAGVDYVARWDNDPAAAGNTTPQERFMPLSFSEFIDDIVPEGGSEDYGTKFQRLDAAITTRNAVTPMTAALSQTEHDATQADIAALNNLSQAQILSDAIPFPGANIDAAISSRAAPGAAMDLVANAVDAAAIANGAIDAAAFAAGAITAAVIATDAIDADALATDAVTEINAAVLAAITALNDLSALEAENAVWDALRSGHTGAGSYGQNTGDAAMRGTDGSNTTVPLPAATAQAEHDQTQADILALTDIDQAGVQAALTAQGYTVARAPNLDDLDAAVSSRAIPGDAMALTAATVLSLVDDIWDELTVGHETAATFGKAITRLFGELVRTKLFFATAAISTGGREVPNGAISHMEVQIRDDGGAFPGLSYFVVFGYNAGDLATAAPRSSNTSATAPTDGTFSSTAFPT